MRDTTLTFQRAPRSACRMRSRSSRAYSWRVRLVLQNSGWLPSYVTRQAKEKKLSRGVICEIELPDGALLVSGKSREEAGELEGRAYKPAAANTWAGSSVDETTDRLKVEWIVRGRPGQVVRITAQHERAGTARIEVALNAA